MRYNSEYIPRAGSSRAELEHPPVITVGINGKDANILVNQQYLKKCGVGVFHVGRGGDITYHGPGQIVGYPILDLNNHGRDVRDYIWKIEEVFIRLLKDEYGVEAARDAVHRGVWIGNNKKIVAVGCSVRRWVTMHGFAFNVSADLNRFCWIISCGINDRGVTSLERLLSEQPDLESVKDLVVSYFSSVFQVEPVETEAGEFLNRITESDYE